MSTQSIKVHPSGRKEQGEQDMKRPALRLFDGSSLAPNRIIAMLQPQILQFGSAVDFGIARKVDITDIVLKEPASRLREAQDNHRSTDALVPYNRHWIDGLYRVKVTDSICSFFKVQKTKDITDSMVFDAAHFYRAQVALYGISSHTHLTKSQFNDTEILQELSLKRPQNTRLAAM